MAFTNPKENLSALNLDDGMIVADFGSGAGTYTMMAAKEVGDGEVYAIDIQKELLEKLKNEAKEKGIHNIEIVWADLEKEEGSHLKNDLIDVAIVSNAFFLVEKKDIFLSEIKRVLRKGGRVLVVDWTDSFGGLGPPSDLIVPEDKAKEIFKKNGFEIERTLFNAGEHHYGFIARKS